MRRSLKLFLIAPLFFLSLGLEPLEADSSPIEATLAPNVLELEASPGEAVERTLTLSYKSGPPLSAVFRKFDFRQREDGAVELSPVEALQPDVRSWSGASWIDLLSPPSELAPGREYPLNLRVGVPEGTEPGEYHAFVSVDLFGLAKDDGVSLVPRLGARLYITVPGEHRRQADDVRVSVERRGPMQLAGPVEVAISLRNGGTLHLDGSGSVELRERLSGATSRLTFPPRRVLPGEEARLLAVLPSNGGAIPFGLYHGRILPSDPTLAAALRSDEVEFWLIDGQTLLAWAAVVSGLWLVWRHEMTRDLGRRLRRACAAFWRG